MKYILSTMMLLLVACGKGNHVPGWSKAQAQDFANKLGYPNAPTECTEWVDALDDDVDATCAVRMGDKIYNVRCSRYLGKCYIVQGNQWRQ